MATWIKAVKEIETMGTIRGAYTRRKGFQSYQNDIPIKEGFQGEI